MPEKQENKYLERCTLVAVLALLIDQFHKFYMIEIFGIVEKKRIEVAEFFNLVMVWNRGISFGMFQGHEYSNYFFMVLTVIISTILLLFARKSVSMLEASGFGLVVGGACGNLIDRILRGAVADFFDFHYSGYHWPAFNIADSCVFVGAAILVYSGIFTKNREK